LCPLPAPHGLCHQQRLLFSLPPPLAQAVGCPVPNMSCIPAQALCALPECALALTCYFPPQRTHLPPAPPTPTHTHTHTHTLYTHTVCTHPGWRLTPPMHPTLCLPSIHYTPRTSQHPHPSPDACAGLCPHMLGSMPALGHLHYSQQCKAFLPQLQWPIYDKGRIWGPLLALA
jgi:hypothetical protein